MRLLVAGANGQLGSDFCQLAKQDGFDVLGLTRAELSNEGVASRYDFATAIVETAKHLSAELRITRIIPVASEDYPSAARRPLYSVLSKSKIRSVLQDGIPHWRSSLNKMLGEVYT